MRQEAAKQQSERWEGGGEEEEREEEANREEGKTLETGRLKQQEVMWIAPGMLVSVGLFTGVGRFLYLHFRFLETRGLHKCGPRWLHSCA